MQINHQLRTFDATAAAVAFPLGGIGTGNVSLSARGQLQDWEIFNRPAKGKNLPNTFFAIRTQVANEDPVARVLEGPLQPPHILSHGYQPSYYGGLPRMAKTKFYGQYPFAKIEFEDPDVPVQVELEAFTPLVPLNPEDSGIPCAVFTYSVHNPLDKPIAVSLVGSLFNCVGEMQYDVFKNIIPDSTRGNLNEVRNDDGLSRGL